MATWPSSLPALPLQEGFRESPPEVVIRTNMDKGPAKVRRRMTTNVRPISMTMAMNNTQVTTFDGFFGNNCAGGATSFDYVNPRTGNNATLRFVGQPVYVPVSGDEWDVSMNVEIMP